MEWIGVGALVLLWMIVSRVQDSLTCLKDILNQMQINQERIDKLQMTIEYEITELQDEIKQIKYIAEDYHGQYLAPLKKIDRF